MFAIYWFIVLQRSYNHIRIFLLNWQVKRIIWNHSVLSIFLLLPFGMFLPSFVYLSDFLFGQMAAKEKLYYLIDFTSLIYSLFGTLYSRQFQLSAWNRKYLQMREVYAHIFHVHGFLGLSPHYSVCLSFALSTCLSICPYMCQ